MNKWEEFIGNNDVDPSVLENIDKAKDNCCFMDIIEIVSFAKNIVVVNSKYHDYSSGGGVARDSHLTVFYGKQAETKKWRYSDKWRHSNDRWDLMIRKIGEIKTKACLEDDVFEVLIECIAPDGHHSRFVTFTFYPE